jgi:hypothetical protein
LRVYVRQLRQKIEDGVERPQYILTNPILILLEGESTRRGCRAPPPVA